MTLDNTIHINNSSFQCFELFSYDFITTRSLPSLSYYDN